MSKQPHNADVENKDDIFFVMGTFEDFFIRFAEEKLDATSPNFTDESNQFGKSIVLFAWDLLLKEARFSRRCCNFKLVIVFHFTVPHKFKYPGS